MNQHRVIAFLVAVAVTTAVEARDLSSFDLGINLHRFIARDRPWVEQLGPVSTRVDVLWPEVSDDKGVVNQKHRTIGTVLAAPEKIRNPLTTLIYGHPAFDGGGWPLSEEGRQAYSTYAEAIVGAVKTRSSRFEIWNEWNRSWIMKDGIKVYGPADGYIQLLAAANKRIKASHPEVEVVGGVMGGIGLEEGWLEPALKGGVLDHLDLFAFHPYFYGTPGDRRLPEIGLMNHMKEVATRIDAAQPDRRIPFLISELGWPTFSGPEGITREEQAKYLARSVLLLALDGRVEGLWIYELFDGNGDPNDREQNFGLITRDGQPKPAYAVFRDLVIMLNLGRMIERLPNDSNGDVVTVRIGLKNGNDAVLGWAIRPGASWDVVVAMSNLVGNTVTRRVGTSDREVLDPVPLGSGQSVRMTVGDTPVLLTGRFQGARVVSVDPAPRR